MARGSSYYYKVALFPSRRKEPVENRVNARRAPQDKSFLRRRKLRPLPVRLPHRGPTRIPGWRIHHFLVSEFKMKIRTSLFRKPFLSKKTEAGETWSPWIFFFFPCGFRSIYTLRAGDLRRKWRRGRSAAVPGAQSRRRRGGLAPAPAGRSDVEVAGWLGFQGNPLGTRARGRAGAGAQAQARGGGGAEARLGVAAEAGPSLRRSTREDRQFIMGEGIWEGSLGALRGRGRGLGSGGGGEGPAWKAQSSQRLRALTAEDATHLRFSPVCVDPASNLRPRLIPFSFLPAGSEVRAARVGELLRHPLGPSATCWMELVLRSLAACQSQVRSGFLGEGWASGFSLPGRWDCVSLNPERGWCS